MLAKSSNKQFRLRNDVYCVGWGVKLYSLTHSNKQCVAEMAQVPSMQVQVRVQVLRLQVQVQVQVLQKFSSTSTSTSTST